MIRVDGGLPQPQTDLGTHRGDPGQARTGTFKGEQVLMKDVQSTLADAAEEISMHHSEKAERKNFSDRKVTTGTQQQLMQIQEINEYLEKAKQFQDPKALKDLAKQLQSGEGNPRELARRQSREPSDQYVLLQYALHDARENGASEEVLERLQDAIADLEMESGPQIRAGLNTVSVAGEFGGTREEVEAFQGVYRDVVLGDSSLAQTLKLVIERLGGVTGDDFKKGLQGLIKALGSDLSSARPSQDANRLQALVQDLYQLEVAATVLDGCHELQVSLDKRFGEKGVLPVELMKELVGVTGERWVGANRFTALAERFNLHDVGAQIAFQMALKQMMREMPPKVFPDPESRQAILDATQAALDHAIEKEEE
jgi:type III secretion protein W